MKPHMLLVMIAALAAMPARADDAAAKKELTPTGKLRVAIAVGPSPSALYPIKDGQGYRGVTITLGTALAQKLGVPIEFVPYLATGEIQGSAASGAWDVSFMPVDEERKKFVDFGNAYHLLQSTYLVAPGSAIKTVAEANSAGVRIAGAKDTATFRASNKASPNATHISLAATPPGARLLAGASPTPPPAVAVPKGHPEALAYASAFIEEAKSSGLVRR